MACRYGTIQWCMSGSGGRERSQALGARSAPACRRGAQARRSRRPQAMQGGRLSCAASPARCGVWKPYPAPPYPVFEPPERM